MRQGPVIIAGGGASIPIDKRTLREIKGSMFAGIDRRFAILLLLNSFTIAILIHLIHTKELPPEKTVIIEEIPERFAKLIIDKPLPKLEKKETAQSNTKEQPLDETPDEPIEETPKTQAEKNIVERKQAQKAVAQRAARVEKKMRTVGVLGMLTGTGSTAKGPSVVDVLGDMNKNKSKFKDLEAALENMSGLQNTKSADILSKKLVKSKEVSIDHREKIDELVSGIESAQTTALTKKGNFVIQRPESIEGAGSSNTKRDNSAINKVVSSNKVSIRMSYEKYLKRMPDLSGKITVRFTISASGRIASVQILENTTGSSELENAIKRKVKMWRFASIPEGDVTVTYPFIFRPS